MDIVNLILQMDLDFEKLRNARRCVFSKHININLLNSLTNRQDDRFLLEEKSVLRLKL
jgi:hypothetical protein